MHYQLKIIQITLYDMKKSLTVTNKLRIITHLYISPQLSVAF